MSKDREAQIRERAYKVWESQGRREGEHEAHWREAEQQLDQEARMATKPDRSPQTRALKKAALSGNDTSPHASVIDNGDEKGPTPALSGEVQKSSTTPRRSRSR